MKKYKVIWFDDEFKTLHKIKEKAALNDIELIGFNNAAEGIEDLIYNLADYDAAIVDGIFFKTAGDKGDAYDDSALFDVGIALEKLSDKKKLPWFILSGQTSFTKEVNPFAKNFKNSKVYDKLEPKDLDLLWENLKKEADRLPETQARHNNKEIFNVFSLGYLSDEVEKQVLSLIIAPLPNNTSEMNAMLVNIRSIQESCFIKLEGIKVIPNSKDSFNNINKHLSGNSSHSSGYKATTVEYQTKEIENLQKWIYLTCGTYIHNLDKQHYDGYMISNYAIESLRNGIFEILLWFKKTFEENK